jgi:hypothetical protein
MSSFEDVLYYPDVSLLLRISLMCSLYLVLKFLPVWPMYCRGQSMHFNLYTPGFFIFVCCNLIRKQMFFKVICGFKCSFYVCISEQFGYVPCFLSYICEYCPFLIFGNLLGVWVVCGVFGLLFALDFKIVLVG